MVRCERFAWPQLCLADHPLVAVSRMLYPIEQLQSFDRQQPLDCVGTWGNVPFKAIGDQIDRLSDFEFMMCHASSRAKRRRRRPILLYQIARKNSASALPARLLKPSPVPPLTT